MALSPSIEEVAPKRGLAPNDDLRISGSVVRFVGRNFNVGQLVVHFGDAQAEVLSRSPSRIDARVPALEPGLCALAVTTDGGTTTAADAFEVLDPPGIESLDPFGFSRDPSGENVTITVAGHGLDLGVGQVPAVVCRLSEPFDPEVQHADESVVLQVLSASPTSIVVGIPPIDRFDRFVGGTGAIVLTFTNGPDLESETWTIEGL